MNLNKGEKLYNFFNLVIQRSVICDNLDPKLALQEAPSDAASAESLVKTPHCSEKFWCNSFSTQTARVNRAENPSQSHPGSHHCCCADSLVEDAVVVS